MRILIFVPPQQGKTMKSTEWRNIIIQTELADIFTSKDYNEDAAYDVNLTVKEIRDIYKILQQYESIKRRAEIISKVVGK
jgi:hypothetical protein